MGTSRHATLRHAGALLLSVGLLAALASAPAAVLAGSVITVNTTANDAIDDGDCTLREAIVASNSDTASGATPGECAAGAGSDTIVFDLSGTINVAAGNELPTVTDDVTIDGGGGITIDGGNDADDGMAVYLATLNIQNLTIQNFAGHGITGKGGVSLSHVDVNANGGGIQLDGSTVTVADSVVRNNATTSGAGIYVTTGSTLNVVRSTISGNSTTGEGGGIRAAGATVTLDRSTVSGNSANEGGGVSFEPGSEASTLKVWNSTIADNSAALRGGGIFREGDIELKSSTIARNTSTTGGAGVFTNGSGFGFAMVNTAIVGNTDEGVASEWSATGELGGAVNVLVGLPSGKTLADLFSPSTLADNGGPTKTLKPKLVTGNLLIDHGSSTFCAMSPISGKDQRGYGRVGTCDIGAVELDRTKPVVSSVRTSLRAGQTLSGTSSKARVTWSASDSGSGVARYTIQRRVDGGSWSTLATGLTSKSYDVTLARTHDYAFRVRAIDKEGNVGSYAGSATVEARLYQQTSSAFAYGGSWGTSSASSYSGGSTRRSSTGGSSARFTATGRSFAWITTTGPTRGTAKVYVNGTLVDTIDLHSDTTTYRVQAWTRSYSSSVSKTIRIVVSGSGERVDVDAFAVLR